MPWTWLLFLLLTSGLTLAFVRTTPTACPPRMALLGEIVSLAQPYRISISQARYILERSYHVTDDDPAVYALRRAFSITEKLLAVEALGDRLFSWKAYLHDPDGGVHLSHMDDWVIRQFEAVVGLDQCLDMAYYYHDRVDDSSRVQDFLCDTRAYAAYDANYTQFS
ncbi:MAG: hypothetical protein SGCHY_005647, partial [Lobulomycetales sp.]